MPRIAEAARKRFTSQRSPADKALQALAYALELSDAVSAQSIGHGPLDFKSQDFLRHVGGRLARREREYLLCYFCTPERRLIKEEVLAFGEAGTVAVPTATIFRRCLELGSRSLILAHNHPSGLAAPSQDDVRANLRLCSQARMLNITIEEHLIVGDAQIFSMRKAGLMEW
ncbi:MAG: hypothetical protein H6918_05225 [Sphingomonadaceae bacterium]|nr:hypothetical protein [Sphingomonadaceae bacterium]